MNDGSTKFDVCIKGVTYAIWRAPPTSWSGLPTDPQWWWSIKSPKANINTDMSVKAHQDIVSLIDLLNKTSDFAGLTTRQFVAKVIKGMQ